MKRCRSFALACVLGPAALAAAAPAAPMPSLARINGYLDQARDLERRGAWAGVPELYAQAIAACGTPVPRHLSHVVAESLVKSGHAALALGRLDDAAAAYGRAVSEYGNSYDPIVRPYLAQAKVLIGRVAEIRQMQSGTPSATAAVSSGVHEPLILLTDRSSGSATGATSSGNGAQTGFLVRSFGGDSESLIKDAEARATAGGRKILATGRDMAVVHPAILPGSCWDWVNAVFGRAGFPEKQRTVVSKAKASGPYLDPALVRPGDWLYYRNRSYGNIEHSGIFVGWVDAPAKVALILSYPGQDRKEPGRYRPYELTGVFRITRPA